MIRDAFGVQVVARDDGLRVSGDKEQVGKAALVLDQMQKKLRRQDWLSTEDVGNAISKAGDVDRERKAGEIDVYAKGGAIKPKTEGQQRYVETMFANDLTFCLGPAGTGKTYLAVAVAASLLKRGQARRIVLARPAVEAGGRNWVLSRGLPAQGKPHPP